MLLSVYFISVFMGLSSATTYWVTLKTSSIVYGGVDSETAIYVKIKGDGGVVSSRLREDDGFNTGRLYEYELSGDVGKIQGVEMSIGGTKDAFLFDWVAVRSSSDKRMKYFYNVDRKWLSTDSREGVTKITMSLQGEKTYIILTKTGTRGYASSNKIGLSMILEGSNGNRAHTSYLSPREMSFDAGEVDEFVLRNMPDLGTVKCVTLKADYDNAWYFDLVAVQDTDGNTVQFPNKFKKFMSSDSSEGMPSMKLCA